MKKIALGLVALSALSTAAFAGNDRSWDAFDIRNGTNASQTWTQSEGLKAGVSSSDSYFQEPGYTNDSK
jgi:hypothetical protein